MAVIHFLLDENVPVAAAEPLRASGHNVIHVGGAVGASTPDQTLAEIAETHGLIVVTFDRDFKTLIRQMPEGSRGRMERSVGRISLRCTEPEARGRIELLMRVIEFHYAEAECRGIRFVMQISQSSLTIVG